MTDPTLQQINPPLARTWGDVFWRHVQMGEDRSSAAARADEWEKRRVRKPTFGVPNSPGYDDAGFAHEVVAAFHADEDDKLASLAEPFPATPRPEREPSHD